MFKITEQTINIQKNQMHLRSAHSGAYASFEGWVRNHNNNRQVLRLEYQAYSRLCELEGTKIIEEARTKFSIVTARCLHRTGALEIGDCAVWLGVSAAHRDSAFNAARYIIDEIKSRLPIWKKEYYKEGDSGWVECKKCGAQQVGSHNESIAYS